MFEDDNWNIRPQFDRGELVFHPGEAYHYKKLGDIGYEQACELWSATGKGKKDIYKMGYRPRAGKIFIEVLQWDGFN